MLRFLRKYNKWILAVGGTLLLIAFLIPDAIQRFSQQSAFMGGTWATTNDGDVTGADEVRLRDEMRIVGLLGDQSIGITGVSKDPVHWYLLQHEAMRAGLVGGNSDGFSSLQQMEQTQPDGPSATAMLNELAISAKVQPGVVLETIAKINGVRRLIALHEMAAKYSDRRIMSAARELMMSVDADLVVIDARRLAESSDLSPSEADLDAHLAQYGATIEGADPYGFGYRLPDRVRIEWLTIPGSSIRRSVETSDRLSNIELRKHRDRNLALFPRAGGASGEDAPDDFDTLRDQVRQHLLTLLASERTAEIAKFATDQVALAQRGVAREGTYLAIPDDWTQRRVSFETLAQAIADQFRIDLPVYRTSGPTMIEPIRIDTLPDVGTATTDRLGTTPMRVSQLVAEAKELDGTDVYAIQVGVALPAFRTPGGDVVLARILDADATRPPHSVDEVRDRMIADLRSLHTYSDLLSRIDSLRADALRDGLVPFARTFDTTVQAAPRIRAADPQFLQFGFKMTPSLPGVGQAEDAIRTLIDAALALPIDVPVQQVPDDRRMLAFGVDKRLAVVVARITGATPLTAEEFSPMRENAVIERTMANEELQGLRDELFSREALTARNGFQLKREVVPEDLDEDFDPNAPDTTPDATARR